MFRRDLDSELRSRLTDVGIKIRIIGMHISRRQKEYTRSCRRIATLRSAEQVDLETHKAALLDQHLKKLQEVLQTAETLRSNIEIAQHQFALMNDLRDINKTMTQMAKKLAYEQIMRDLQALQDNVEKAHETMTTMNTALSSKAVDPATLERIRNDAMELSRTRTTAETPMAHNLAEDIARRLENA